MCRIMIRSRDVFRVLICLLELVALHGGDGVSEEPGGRKRRDLGPLIEMLAGKVSPRPPLVSRQKEDDQHMEYMASLYKQSADQNGNPKANRSTKTNTIRLVKPSSSVLFPSSGHWHVHHVEYNLQYIPELEHLIKVVVVYLHSPLPNHFKVSCEIKCPLANYVDVNSLQNDPAIEIPIKFVLKMHDKWAEADVTPCVHFPSGNFVKKVDLNISYKCVERGNVSQGIPDKKEHAIQLQVPSLLLYLNDTAETAHQRREKQKQQFLEKLSRSHVLSRKPRQLSNIGSDIPNFLQKRNPPRNICKLHSFWVSFEQLGWDHWIVAPHKYNPKFCRGDCPRILHYGYHSPNHAIVQNFINEIVDKNVPRPSCVPSKYSPISVLMKEQNDHIVYKEYEDMIAVSCTCK
ncbi:bone morphogenetic protein 15-like [Pristis pectinata]|uniref:bone morphogenetic protein 15-like n=1 Tax=Pristis pectinata TaxID=685728 RepID=UPI00223D3674|nr:bone morphogenetic protein 15-like [Pristis pectinata]